MSRVAQQKLIRLTAERHKRGWSLRELGRQANVQYADIWRIEHGMRPYPGQALRLAATLGLTPAELTQVVRQSRRK